MTLKWQLFFLIINIVNFVYSNFTFVAFFKQDRHKWLFANLCFLLITLYIMCGQIQELIFTIKAIL